MKKYNTIFAMSFPIILFSITCIGIYKFTKTGSMGAFWFAIIFFIFFTSSILLSIHELKLSGHGIPRQIHEIEDDEIFIIIGEPIELDEDHFLMFVQDRHGEIWSVELYEKIPSNLKVFKVVNGSVVNFRS